MAFKTDIEIARAAQKKPIQEIGAKLGIPSEALLPYGHDKAKVGQDFIEACSDRPNGKLILVTAINPTPAGEGKTTTTVGLGDGLNRIGKKAAICIREASLGPELRDEGGRRRRRQCAGRADGGHEPPFHRRFPRDHLGAQPAERDDRQPHLLGQRARDRRTPRGLAPRARHERPGAARYRDLARRRGQRLPAADRLRHHRGLRGHGDPVPCDATSRTWSGGWAT
jgi:hypothetical protein